MSLRNRLTGVGLTLGLLVTFSLPVLAQSATTTQEEGSQQQTERMGKKRWHRGGHGMRGGMGMFRELDLSDAQKQQASAIIERYRESSKPQREEMRQLHQQKRTATGAVDTQAQARAEALRTELRETHKRMQDELLTILTPDQRAKWEQLKAERKARHEERRARRQGQTDDNQ